MFADFLDVVFSEAPIVRFFCVIMIKEKEVWKQNEQKWSNETEGDQVDQTRPGGPDGTVADSLVIH